MQWPRLSGPALGGQSSGGGAFSSQVASSSKGEQPMLGQFDPAELERGATALHDIDSSKHSAMAFQLGFMQEQTEQLTHRLAMEKERLERARLESNMAERQGEEARRTISHMADQERSTAQYRAEVEASMQNRKLEHQREVLEYKLKREQELFSQHETIRIANEQELEAAARETLKIRAGFDRETAVASALAEAKGRAQQERENIEVRMREMRAQTAEDRRSRLAAIDEVFSGLASGAQALYEDRSKMITLVGGLTALALGVYSSRTAARVAGTVLERHLGRPPLVRETSRWTLMPKLSGWPWARKSGPGIFERIVLEDQLTERLQWTTNALLNAQENGTPFRHLLLHGPPGTGKTLFARTLARQSGLEYAIMSGGDLGPLGREGPHELHKLFAWAANSRRGLVLFIDEADAFLRTGRAGEGSMGEDARNALSVFLHHTGTENARLAVILATNVPGTLDRAVVDRIDEAFEFPRPAYDQRVQLLQMFVDRYLMTPMRSGRAIELDPALNESYICEVAKRTEGLSGRQLAKLVLAFQSAVFGSGTQRLTKGLADTVLQWRLAHPNA